MLFVTAAMTPQEITDRLQLNKIKDKLWSVEPTIATEGTGLAEAFKWLSDNTKEKK